MSIQAVMRTSGEKNFAEAMPPLLPRMNQRGNREVLAEERHKDDHANNAHGNGAGALLLPPVNEKVSASPLPSEPNTLPSATTNGSEDGAAVFPYIPRKRQERNGLLIEHFYLPAASASGDQVDFLILGESRVGVLLADVSGIVSPGCLPIIKTALRSNSTGLSTAATLRF